MGKGATEKIALAIVALLTLSNHMWGSGLRYRGEKAKRKRM